MAWGGKREGSGRKKGYAALEAERQRDYVAKVLEEEFIPIVAKAVEQAKEGDKNAREWITDRAYGKATQFVDHTTDGKELPQPLLFALRDVLSDNNSSKEDSEAQEED